MNNKEKILKILNKKKWKTSSEIYDTKKLTCSFQNLAKHLYKLFKLNEVTRRRSFRDNCLYKYEYRRL